MVLYVWIMKYKTGMMMDDVVKGVYSAAGPVKLQLFAVMDLRFRCGYRRLCLVWLSEIDIWYFSRR